MPSLLESCEKYFDTKNPYEILKIPKTASASEVKKAYKKLSLLVHPDRVAEEEKEVATEKFKVLGKIHAILNDAEKRAVYDDTGCLEDEDFVDDNKDWNEYWRLLFKEVTFEDLTEYEEKYKGSEEELKDIKAAYEQGEGCMQTILDSVLFTTYEDEGRLRKIIQKLIKKGELPEYDKFVNEDSATSLKRKRKAEKEAKEAEKLKEEVLNKKKNGHANLAVTDPVTAILQRKKEREAQSDAFFEHLTQKYGNKKSGGRKAKK